STEAATRVCLVFPPVTSQLPESSRESCSRTSCPLFVTTTTGLEGSKDCNLSSATVTSPRLSDVKVRLPSCTCFHWPISCSPFLNFIVSAIPRTLRSAVNVIKHSAIFIGTSQKVCDEA